MKVELLQIMLNGFVIGLKMHQMILEFKNLICID